MKIVKVNLGDRSYPIIIGAELLNRAGRLIKAMPYVNSAFIITNNKIKRLYGAKLIRSLRFAGIRTNFMTVADSEKSKSVDTWINAIHAITRFDKASGGVAVLAFGGGVVGDLGGFVAACYRRGVALVQIPTTLLSQVDSAIGGKTAVDLPFGKNLVGAYYQPNMVITDIKLLMSLPESEIKNGIAEVIKYAVIFDKRLFQYLEKNIKQILLLNKDCLSRIVLKCSQLKARVVAADEKETKGQRLLLNLGHTIGHALEAAASYSEKITHGEAVALGMLCACDIAKDLGILNEADAVRIEDLINKVGLPSRIKGLSVSKIINATLYDKKVIVGRQRFILPVAIGHAVVCNDIDRTLIKRAIYRRAGI